MLRNVRPFLRFLPLLAACALAAGCSAWRRPPDPRVELARQHDGWWAHLAATYDGDRDGRIARGEYTRGDDAFARLDRDGDGTLTRSDFDRDLVLPPDLVLPILLVRLAGGPEARSVGTAAACDALALLDTGGDGRINREEFECGGPPPMAGVDGFGTLLAGMDEDGDGLVSLPEIERYVARRDVDGDGVLLVRERALPGPAPCEGFIEPAEREPAPDFVGAAVEDGRPVALSSLTGKRPLALVFGSFT